MFRKLAVLFVGMVVPLAALADDSLAKFKGGIGVIHRAMDPDRQVVDVINGLPERSRYLRGLRSWCGFKQIGIEFERHARAGRNVVTVCVANDVVNELGTGGIVAPVFLYAPAAGADAKLDNGRFSLKETFP